MILGGIDYAKNDYRFLRHHERFRRRAQADGLTCQQCGGAGGHVEPVLDYGEGPFMECGWCEGTGYVTRWLRGQWLRIQRAEKRTGGAK